MSDLAGWVQAGVAILGFGAAIGVPAFQRWTEVRDRRREAARKARALALYLRPAIEGWLELIDLVVEEMRTAEVTTAKPSEFLNAVLHRNALQAPARIRRQLDEIYVLAGVGDDLFDALTAAYESRSIAQAILLDTLDVDEDERAIAGAEMVARKFALVRERLVRARMVISEIVETSGTDRLAALIRRSN
jgi:hypothetical protein